MSERTERQYTGTVRISTVAADWGPGATDEDGEELASLFGAAVEAEWPGVEVIIHSDNDGRASAHVEMADGFDLTDEYHEWAQRESARILDEYCAEEQRLLAEMQWTRHLGCDPVEDGIIGVSVRGGGYGTDPLALRWQLRPEQWCWYNDLDGEVAGPVGETPQQAFDRLVERVAESESGMAVRVEWVCGVDLPRCAEAADA